MQIKFIILLFLCFSVHAYGDSGEIARRIYNHLIIKDIKSALEEGEDGLKRYPDSKEVHAAYVNALAQSGDEKRMTQVWGQYAERFPDDAYNDELLETMAWGIIKKGSESSSPMTRVIGLLAALFSNDIKGVNILYANLHHQNALIRSVAVQLSANNFDDKLRDEMLAMLQTEKNWIVRLEVIKAVGKMRDKRSKEMLEGILVDKNARAEEKAAAIQALVNMLETADRDYVAKLAGSDRAGLRLLACQAVQQFDLYDDLDLIEPLFSDPHAEVRKAAVMALGVLRVEEYNGEPVDLFVSRFLQDTDSSVAITAAWVILLNNPLKGQEALTKWLENKNSDIRRYAASVLVSGGKYALPLLPELFENTDDPYIRMNCALGLISQRIKVPESCQALYEGLSTIKENWMWDEKGPFTALAPSKVKHQDLIPQLPQATNQSTRLDILNILAILKFNKTQNAIKIFLNDCTESMTGVAAALLLTEGDDEALSIVRGLLTDRDDKVRIHAALILALWGREESIIQMLQDFYPKANRQQKEQILEGLGHVGAKSSIPFFMEVLNEPYQTLRLIAACGLIQCLNH